MSPRTTIIRPSPEAFPPFIEAIAARIEADAGALPEDAAFRARGRAQVTLAIAEAHPDGAGAFRLEGITGKLVLPSDGKAVGQDQHRVLP